MNRNNNQNKKYVIIIIDGAADYSIESLGNKTALQAAKKPAIDYLARHGTVGMVKTIPDGIAPGSDTANLSILGYDPLKYSTGRSSLEAISMGIELDEKDITFRCNLVTLSYEQSYMQKEMIDYSAGEITTAEAKILISELAKELNTENIKFYPGISYRHVIILKNGVDGGEDVYRLVPPHDISGKIIEQYLPSGAQGGLILDMMIKSSIILSGHPVNGARVKKGLNPANSIWIWAKAKKPSLDSFYGKYGLKGSVISAVDLVKGIGICAGLHSIDVEGATGNIHTNYAGKAKATLNELKKGQDFVYLHIEAPDECGHQGNAPDKVKSIELIDEKVVGPIKEGLDSLNEDYEIMVLPDHPTPVIKKTHTTDPVPFLIYDTSK